MEAQHSFLLLLAGFWQPGASADLKAFEVMNGVASQVQQLRAKVQERCAMSVTLHNGLLRGSCQNHKTDFTFHLQIFLTTAESLCWNSGSTTTPWAVPA